MDYITFDIILNITMYFLYFLIVFVSVYVSYILTTTQKERKRHRTRLQYEFYQQKEKVINRSESSILSKKLYEAGNPLNLNSFRFQIIRWSLILSITIYYLIIPYLKNESISLLLIAFIIAIVLVSSTILPKGSLTIFILDEVIKIRNKKKQIELFTLFDMLQAELTSLNDGQEVNVYNLLKDLVPYFDYIDIALIKYLHLWKNDPIKAKEALAMEIGGEDAERLSDILYKIDDTTKEHAINIIQGASKLFSTGYYERGNRKSEKKNTFLYIYFFAVNLLILIWVVVLVVIMYTDLLNSTNIKTSF